MDVEERKYYVYKCQEWQYLSNIITFCYPKVCYAQNTLRWTNWGDWEAHPNLASDHFWGQPPLYYHIKWVGGEVEGGISLTTALILGGIIAAIIAAIAGTMIMRKRKIERMLIEGEEEDKMEELEEEREIGEEKKEL